jgi:DNA-binding MarR family transcriptional regulator
MFGKLVRRVQQADLRRTLTPTQKSILVAMATFANTERGDGIYPAYSTLGAFVGVTRGSAIRAVEVLEELGYVVIVQRSKGGSHARRCNLWRLNLQRIADDAAATDTSDEQ